MQKAKASKTKNIQNSGQHHTTPTVTNEASTSNAGMEGILPSIETQKGNDYSSAAFERHAALLGDPRMSQRMYDQQRIALAQRLQRDYGNRYVQRLVDHIRSKRTEGIQTKLTVGPAGDKYEIEADRVAKQVVGMTEPPVQRQDELEEEELQMKSLVQRQDELEEEELQMKPLVQRQDELEEEELQMKSLVQRQDELEEEDLQMKPLVQRQDELEEEELQAKPLVQRKDDGQFEASGEFESRLASKRGGSQLPEVTRSFMEPRFGADFSNVRVHTDGDAAQMNREIGAQAFTHGADVFFGAGKYDPATTGGKRLLAHELTHVMQQTGGSAPGSTAQRNFDGGYEELGISGSLWADLGNRPDILEAADVAAAKKEAAKGLGISAKLWGVLGNRDAILGKADVAAAKKEAARGLGINQGLWDDLEGKDEILQQDGIDEAREEARQVLSTTLTSKAPGKIGITEHQFQIIGRRGQDKVLLEATSGQDARDKVLGVGVKAKRKSVGMAKVIGTTHLRKSTKIKSDYRLEMKRVGDKLKAGAELKLYDKYAQASNEEWQLAEYKGTMGFVRLSKVMKAGATQQLTEEQEARIGEDYKPEKFKLLLETAGYGGSVSDWLGELGDVGLRKIIGKAGKLPKTAIKEFEDWYEATNEATFKSVYKTCFPNATEPDIKEALEAEIVGQWGNFVGGLASSPLKLGGDILGVISSGGDIASGAFGGISGLIGMAAGIARGVKSDDDWKTIEAVVAAAEGGIGAVTGAATGAIGVGGVVTKIGAMAVGEGWKVAKDIFGFLGAGIRTVKGYVATNVGIVKTVYGIFKEVIKKEGKTGDIVEQAGKTLKSAFDTVREGVNTLKGILKTFANLPKVVGAILGIVADAIYIATAALSALIESRTFIKRVIDLIRSIKLKIKLSRIPSPSSQVKHLIKINTKRIRRAIARGALSFSKILADFLHAFGYATSFIATIIGIATSPSGVGPAIAAAVSLGGKIFGEVSKGVLKSAGAFIGLVHKGIMGLKHIGRKKQKHEKRAESAIAIMKQVAGLPGYEGNKSEYDEVELLLEATGVDLPKLFGENGKPEKQIEMLMKAMEKR